ncbi:hypothetical protein [Jatrophihabitans lederbergiae]|uniref:Uncharacterized protein n=1 Tax=Jatrophihabitans lederbergiae TaxID=3075547 RepID=A0ABU2JHV6_9ACTN|nr:hypothetical protein [Jatrophihabitans sp. DSM 44399]MDT0264539.1 hypothetical protein [Jatrophihabitans sp. DSM 44399]
MKKLAFTGIGFLIIAAASVLSVEAAGAGGNSPRHQEYQQSVHDPASGCAGNAAPVTGTGGWTCFDPTHH